LLAVPRTVPTNRFPLVAWIERRSRRQVIAAAVVVGIYLCFRGASSLAGVLLDRWWFHSVTDVSVWSTITSARLLLATVAGVVTLLVLAGSLSLVRRRGDAPSNEVGGIVRRYRGRMGPAHHWMLAVIVAVITIRVAAAANSHWQEWLLFRRGDDLDHPVPELGRDLGYYLFKLPLFSVVSGWVRQVLLVALALTAFAAWVSGGLRLPGRGRRSPPATLAHLALLATAFAAAQALDYVFVRRPALAVSRSGSFTGPGYTELRIGVPGTWILAVVAIVVGFILVVAVRTDRWRLPSIAVAGWAVLHLVLVTVAPAIVDRFVVAPAEGARQLRYLEHHLDATRDAFGLDAVEQGERTIADGLSPGFDLAGAEALDHVPLFDVTRLPASLQVLQGRTATRITDVDLDRYPIDGVLRPVMVAARSSSRDDLPESGWVQQHLVYTHGNGVVVVPADQPDADGRPDVDSLAEVVVPARSELYFGEGMEGWYAIVDTKRAEQGNASFDADTGIDASSAFRRAILTLSTGDIEPLFSAELTSESQLLYRRDVRERLAALAPFATFGHDPYPVVTEAGVVWVVDGYTTSSTYPYAQFVDFAGDQVNFVHASLKATVDAYDGTVHLYRTEAGGADDPILDAWEDIFPGLVEPIANMPAELREHLLYPPELLTIQTQLLGRYHVDDAETLFNGTRRWSPAAAAAPTVGAASPGPASPVALFMPTGGQSEGQSGGSPWVSVLPYSPGSGSSSPSIRDQLAALAIADHDAGERLELVAVDSDPGRDLSTPLVAQSAIDADPEIAQLITLLNANGSHVEFGPMTPLLLDDGLVWVRSIIVTGTSATTAPRLYGVVAVSNGLVGSGDDVRSAIGDALAQLGAG
jgi:uncharacterized membrane protein (UPF0182 family)